MRTDPPPRLGTVLLLAAYSLVAIVFAWHCWREQHALGLQFWSVMFPLSLYLTGKMIRKMPVLIIPPLIVIAFGIAWLVSPLWLVLYTLDALGRWALERRRARRSVVRGVR
ncbi:hypothetical protein FAZ95_39045 [Trinickia violacea]|uniref:DUF2484 family protein n=1 Tax=Trinickia violacea TaxID=2571746 RepID=A0A4P8J092_9BURK|nr:hypothetical protein [Trinickia violacea]QCP55128.1 hypothetical protein FAZ95_39045 [Trinickia violacea]